MDKKYLATLPNKITLENNDKIISDCDMVSFSLKQKKGRLVVKNNVNISDLNNLKIKIMGIRTITLDKILFTEILLDKEKQHNFIIN